MNSSALIAVLLFALVFLGIIGWLYSDASKSHRRGEMSFDGIAILRLALFGTLVIYAILGLTAILD